MDRADVDTWVAAYERLWRTPGTDRLAEVFTDDVSYLTSPWAKPVTGIGALAKFWEKERASADEPFTIRHTIVAVDGDTAVVRVEVEYEATGDRWRDLWVIEFAADGRGRAFEEWPFAPRRRAGH